MRFPLWPRLVWAAAFTVGLSACGGSDSTTPNPVATPTPAAGTTTIFTASLPGIAADGIAVADFSIPNSGDVRMTFDWSSTSNNVDIWVFSGTACTDFAGFLRTGNAQSCNTLGIDTGPNRPAVVTINSTQAQTARILALNRGPAPETVSVQVTLTR
ncbi:MAG: hypothetical protein ABW221_11420 [Vicinamibacteria bacterium]